MAYCTAVEVKSMANDREMSDFVVDMLIDAVCAAIDRFCRRTFTTEVGARTLDYSSGDEIKLPIDLAALTSITTNAGQSFTANDCVLEPRLGPPFVKIVMKTEIGKYLQYSGTTREAITVTGTWGYKLTVPAEIKYVAISGVIDAYNRIDLRGLDGVSGSGIRANPSKLETSLPVDLQALLKSFRRIRIEALTDG